MTPAELDDAIARFQLDERVARFERERVEQRARAVFWNRYDAGMEDLARRQWTPWVEAGGMRCMTCHQPISPGDRWIIDPISADKWAAHFGLGPEHARCVIEEAS